MRGTLRSVRTLRLVALSFAILGITALAYAVVSTKATFDWRASCVKQLTAGILQNVNALADRVNAEQDFYLRITPSADYVLQQSVGLVAFDAKAFPEELVAGLIPALDHGCPTYTILVAEDPATRILMVYNAEGKAIYAIHPYQGYDPYRLLNQLYPDLENNRYTSQQVARLRAEYDPARVQIILQLIPSDWIEGYAEARYETLATRTLAALGFDEGGAGMMSMRLPAADSNIVIQTITPQTNGTQLEIGYPTNFTNHLEIFASTDLVAFTWALAATNLSTAGTNTLWWLDTDTNQLLRFYAAGDGDVDSDADGLTDAREHFIYHTSMTNADTDGDGLIDPVEIFVYGTNPNNRDPDGDGMADDEELLAGTNPSVPNAGASSTSIRYYYDVNDRLIGAYSGTDGGGGVGTYSNTPAGNISTIAERRTP